MPITSPLRPNRITEGNHDAEQLHCQGFLNRVRPRHQQKQSIPHDLRREDKRQGTDQYQRQEHQVGDARSQPPGTLTIFLCQEAGKHRDERRS
jgi:hypothetical protein